ncbi:MAG: trypsin-like peptidase domain-containing protein [Clostridia bacterium]|nr:trypsin-like peptidase domain-containing protein [Clostridia bacterium]
MDTRDNNIFTDENQAQQPQEVQAPAANTPVTAETTSAFDNSTQSGEANEVFKADEKAQSIPTENSPKAYGQTDYSHPQQAPVQSGAGGVGAAPASAGKPYSAPTSSVAWNASAQQSPYAPQPQYRAGNVPPAPPAPPAKKPKKKMGKAAKIALGLAAVFVVGLCGGIVGTKLTKSVSGGSGDAVIYQSDTKTSSETDSTGSAKAANTVESVANNTAASVVEVKTSYVQKGSFFGDYVTSGAGSGVIISKDGYVVTNNHVIADAQDITVTLKSGKEYTAKLVGTDEKTDIAVLKIDAKDLTPATYGDSSAVAVGEQIIVVGNPLGSLGGSVTTGIISATDREITVEKSTMTLLQIDAAVNPGNSGGALFNLKGELVGVVNAKYSSEEVEGLGFAIPINTAKATIEDIIEYGYVKGRAQLGITAVEITDLQTAYSAGVTELGVYVYSVNSGSGADKAGLKAGDRIVKIDDKEIDSYSTLSKLLDSYSVGDKVSVTYSRNGEQKSVDVTLIEYKPSNDSKSSNNQQNNSQNNQSQYGYGFPSN